ncbi:MAG: hypothetical protein AAF790_09040 [Planctomycetota bacterium]
MPGSRRQPDARQGRLDFESGFAERMTELRAQLAAVDPADLELSPTEFDRVREVVLAVYAAAGATPGHWSRTADHDLVGGTRVDHRPLSVSQFRRYRTVARKAGLLQTRAAWQGSCRLAGAWRVDRETVGRLADAARRRLAAARPPSGDKRRQAEPSAADAAQPNGLPADPPRDRPRDESSDRPSGSLPAADGRPPAAGRCEQLRTAANSCEQLRTAAKTYRNPQTPTLKPQTPSHPPPGAEPLLREPPPPDVGGWAEVLVSIGVARDNAGPTLGAFAAAGGSREDLDELLAVYRSKAGAWGPGAVVTRLRRWAAGQAADEHWPPVAADWGRQERRRREAEAAQAKARAAAADVAAAAESKAAITAWQAMPRDERVALLVASTPGWRKTGLPDESPLWAGP